jgi:hypothetical protein
MHEPQRPRNLFLEKKVQETTFVIQRHSPNGKHTHGFGKSHRVRSETVNAAFSTGSESRRLAEGTNAVRP